MGPEAQIVVFVIFALVVVGGMALLLRLGRLGFGARKDGQPAPKLGAILIADDSQTTRKVLELTLMDAADEIVAAGDGTSAIAQLEARRFDLVFADVHMPEPSGYEVCRRAKELSPTAPAALLIGAFERPDEDAYRACGADRLIKKPFDTNALLRWVVELARAEERPS